MARSDTDAAVEGLLQRSVIFECVEVEPRLESTGNMFPGPRTYQAVPLPRIIRRWCEASKCRAAMDWRLVDGYGTSRNSITSGMHLVRYTCVQSEDVVEFALNFFHAGSYRLALVGCWPEPRPPLSLDLRDGLGEIGQHLYLNALVCRGAGRGIGAVTYARRTIEQSMDGLLVLLHDLLADDGDPLPLERVAELKRTNSFEEKARHADAVLPPRLFPGQQNPFVTLHGLLSDGVHNLDDVESCERFDECRALIELLFERLHRESDSKRLYAEGVKRLRPRESQSRRSPK
jgi:hypothetical protein